jgi:anthraniloyl-CoA monooxygenase
MRIAVLGGGPAGLYFSLLAKKGDPSREITLYERNPRGATFGWGVVFSEETLGALRDADRRTEQAITDRFASWGSIDVHYGGEVVRSRGHSFSGIARRALLGVLQDRCEELGVELRFEQKIADPDAFAEDHDLVVAADGVNSAVRARYAEALRPNLDTHRSKYIWFGTDLVFDAFTFIFRDTEHGMFQVHAYPFDATTSTFIVETTEDTWRRAGLEGATEDESIAFCRDLFAPELGGHTLMSNRSQWISFVTVRCDIWHRGNVVLAGDAAHTAHFTIGSGTKLAMEDAIALAEAITVAPDLDVALVGYEMARQPVVERFQEAARQSATYFESVSRYRSFEPVQFAFNLLTRSGRITHLELERRDPAFVARVDRWTSGSDVALPAPPLFSPYRLGDVAMRDRVVMRGIDGRGAGLVLTEMVAVTPDGRTTPETPTADDLQGIVDAVHASGARVCVQLGHAGRRGATRTRSRGVDVPLADGAWPLIAPSPIPYTAVSAVPAEMTRADMDAVRDAFLRTAGRCAEAGADAIEMNAAQGYLLGSFLSPLANQRSDEYGEAHEARIRFPIKVITAVREAWRGPLVVRITATDWAPGGAGIEDAVQIAAALRDAGVDAVHVSAGGTVPYDRPDFGRMFLAPYADRIRNEAGIPTIVGGNLTTADEINTLIAAGRADLCVLDPRGYAPTS